MKRLELDADWVLIVNAGERVRGAIREGGKRPKDVIVDNLSITCDPIYLDDAQLILKMLCYMKEENF